jgi:hypothetical protein
MVSPEDAPLLNIRFQLHPKGYVHARQGRLHRLVLNAPVGLIVDHINHDKMDNRRPNLRLVTDAQSVRNRKKLRRNSAAASPYIGVHRNGAGWIARIVVNGKRRSFGTYPTQIEAAKAYDAAAREHVGEFANLNFGG